MSLLGEIERSRTGAAAEDRGVLRFITAGSVDDGKSTLIGRLLHDTRAVFEDQLDALARASKKRGQEVLDLSLLTDGLEAEREQGITIDVAYRHFSTRSRRYIIADTPGHEQYTRNMVTGASTADAAVILIDARKGVLPQTRRHTAIAHLLGIRHLIVAVNKMDLVGYARARFDAIRGDFLEFAAPLEIAETLVIPISALRGDMVAERGKGIGWYPGPTLLEALEGIDVNRQADALPMRFPVQFVRRPGAGGQSRAYAGRVESGVIMPGDEVIALPSGRRTVVREVLTFDGARHAAAAGESVALVLRDEIDLSRGDLIAESSRPPRAAQTIAAKLCWLADEPLAASARYALRHTTRTVKARFASLDYRIDIDTLAPQPSPATLQINDIARVTLSLQQPIFADPYQANRATGSFIVIDEATNQTVAAGMIE